ncbi:MAG: 23S rRNA (adenine(2503)-C(2))-methyltransferase RlmN [Lachnospiraceae bacterium]|nr:23S rRNA (adenine(2503)-C(2))-methyltransferase RlmN [Candidatus Merdinaster equi]
MQNIDNDVKNINTANADETNADTAGAVNEAATDIDKADILSMNMDEIKELMKRLGEPAFRAGQIFSWLHEKRVSSFEEMSNLSKALREKLAECCEIATLVPQEVLTSKIDGTKKFLFALSDGNIIESVWMQYKHGNSVCISSQVGCKMGCKFCASTLDGCVRSLKASEMLGQIYRITDITGERVSNVVIMGSGEPLDNYDNLIRFLELISDEKGLCISQRNITVSTCGIVPKMLQLADLKPQITLALSLHASNQKKREELMPIAKAYEIHEVVDACKYYFDKTGRRITFEYSLVGGINDTDDDARELTQLIRGINCHVNLIPVNPIKERDYVSSEDRRVQAFKLKLEKNGVHVTIRREMGRDISGACGQLRRSYLSDVPKEDKP